MSREQKDSNKELKAYGQMGVAMTCRSFEEYGRMFALHPEELQSGPVLDVAAGASSFTADACRLGLDAYAADPLYVLDTEAIRARGMKEIEESTAKLEALREQFDWSFYGSLERHRSMREGSIERFVAHKKSDAGRYAQAALPELPFADGTFAHILVSHFLFLYGEQFDPSFHLAALRELMRLCRQDGEVRIYPLITLQMNRYPHLDHLLEELKREGIEAGFLESSLPFIPGSFEVLRLRYA